MSLLPMHLQKNCGFLCLKFCLSYILRYLFRLIAFICLQLLVIVLFSLDLVGVWFAFSNKLETAASFDRDIEHSQQICQALGYNKLYLVQGQVQNEEWRGRVWHRYIYFYDQRIRCN